MLKRVLSLILAMAMTVSALPVTAWAEDTGSETVAETVAETTAETAAPETEAAVPETEPVEETTVPVTEAAAEETTAEETVAEETAAEETIPEETDVSVEETAAPAETAAEPAAETTAPTEPVVTVLPTESADAPVAQDHVDSGIISDTVQWYFDDTVLYVVGSGDANCSAADLAYDSTITGIVVGEGITSISGIYGCPNAEYVQLPATLTSIGGNCFTNCASLWDIVVAEGNETFMTGCQGELLSLDGTTLYRVGGGRTGVYEVPDTVSVIEEAAFGGCGNLTGITIPETVYSIGVSAFQGCTSLTEITLPDSASNLFYGGIFYGCTNLASVTLPERMIALGYSFFQNCTSLKGVTLPDTIQEIGYSAFQGSGITSLTIPAAVAAIGNRAIADCADLETITFTGNAPAFAEDTFENTTAVAFYPADDTTWTADVMQNYGGKITWVLEGETPPETGEDYACGDSVQWEFVADTGTLRIYGEGPMRDYDYEEAPWYTLADQITAVTLESGVTKLGTCSLYGMSNVTTVTLADTVTLIEPSAMQGCTGLTSITMPGVRVILDRAFSDCESLAQISFGSELVRIGSNAFEFTALTELTLPASVSDLYDMAFYGMDSLTAIHVAEGNETYCSVDGVLYSKDKTVLLQYPQQSTVTTVEETVTEIGAGAYMGVSSLPQNAIPAGVTAIGVGAFQRSGLTELVLPEAVTTISESAFSYCRSLTSADLGNVETIGSYAFEQCSELRTLTLGDKVQTIGWSAFNWCNRITELTFPATLTSIGDYAFASIIQLKKIIFQGTAPTIGGYAFQNVTATVTYPADDSWTSVANQNYGGTLTWEAGGDVPPVEEDPASGICGESVYWEFIEAEAKLRIYGTGAIADYSYSDPAPWKDYTSQIESVTVESGVTSLGAHSLYGLSAVQEITLPQTVTTIGNRALAYCTTLTSLTIPNGVVTIGDYALAGCSKLTSLTLGSSVTTIGEHALESCSSMVEITLPASLTTLGDYALAYLSKLQNIYVEAGNTNFCSVNGVLYNYDKTKVVQSPKCNGSGITVDTVTEIGTGAFYNSTALMGISIPNGVKTIGEYAYYSCYNPKEIAIPDSVETIGADAFNNCNQVTVVTIGNGVKEIGTSAFLYCSQLRELTLGESVEIIGEEAFESCYNLASVTIPASVKTLGSDAFYGCNTLTEITFLGNAPTIGRQAFYNVTATAYYPADDATWTEDVRQNYGGNITWVGKAAPLPTSGSCGENAVWAFDEASGTLTISGSGDMESTWWPYDLTDEAPVFAPWHGFAAQITSVQIESGITSLGHFAFYDCVNLESITIPESVTMVGCAFVGSGLKELHIPASVTDLRYPTNEGVCETLLKITVDENNPVYSNDEFGMLYNKDKTQFLGCPTGYQGAYTIAEGVTEIGGWAFTECDGLTELTIPSSVAAIKAYAFSGCDVPSVTFCGDAPSIGAYAFADMTATFYYPAGNTTWTEDVRREYGGTITWVAYTAIVAEGTCGTGVQWTLDEAGLLRIFGSGAMTDYASSPNEGIRPEWDSYSGSVTAVVVEEGVSHVGSHAFAGMHKITSAQIKGAESIGNSAFAYCTALKEIICADGLKTIGDEAFTLNGDTLERLVLPASVESIGSNPVDWSEILTIEFGGTAKQWCQMSGSYLEAVCADGTYLNGGLCGDSTYYYILEEGTGAIFGEGTAGGYFNVAESTYVTSMVVEEGITELTASNAYLENLRSITLPATLTRMVGLNCNSDALKEVHISDLAAWCAMDFASSNYYGYAKLLRNGAKLYLNGAQVTDAVLPESATVINNYAFSGYTNLKTIFVPETVTYVGEFAFEDCAEDLTVTYGGTMAQWLEISDSSVKVQCSDGLLYGGGLCGEAVSWLLTADGTLTISGEGAMYDCNTYDQAAGLFREAPWKNVQANITSLVVEEGVTSIGNYAFTGCSNLQQVTFPASLEAVGREAFGSCQNLTVVRTASIADWCGIAFADASGNPLSYAKNLYVGDSKSPVTGFTAPSVIGQFAFYGCTGLKEVILPADVSIGYGAFYGCTNLTAQYQGTYEQWEAVDYTGVLTTLCADGTRILGRGVCDPDDPSTSSDDVNTSVRWVISSGGELRISGSGAVTFDNWNYNSAWGAASDKITSVVIEPGITGIQAYALNNIYNAAKLVIGPDVDNIANGAIGSSWKMKTIVFQGCPAAIGEQNFEGMTAWAYYNPAHGWTEDKLGQYAAEALYWIAYEDEADINDSGAIRIIAPSDTLVSAKSMTLRYDLFGQTGYKLKWMVDDTSVATISSAGKLTAKKTTALKSVAVTLVAYPKKYSASAIPGTPVDLANRLPEGCMYTTYVIHVHPVSTGVQIADGEGNVLSSGATVELDITDEEVTHRTFRAVTLPDDALKGLTWTVSDKSEKYAEYEIDNETGTITVRNPKTVGTVTLTATATDGSKKTANVKVKVIYADAAQTLTASADVPAIGLQPTQTAQMQVFGTDKTAALDSKYLSFTSSSEAIATVDEYGVITGGDTPGTATITAALAGDPQNRKVSLKVKVIAAQTQELILSPGIEGQEDRIFPLEDEVGVHMDKNDVASGAWFYILAEAADTLGNPMEVTSTSLKWASSNTAIATVTANENGATVTIKAKADGACVITATTADAVKLEQSFAVYVRNYAPRLGTTALTLNSYTGSGVSTSLVASYGNEIEALRLYEYNSKKKAYSEEESQRLAAQLDGDTLTITNSETLSGTIKLKLQADCENGKTYDYTLTLTVKNSAPTIAVKQTGKFNTFLRDSEAALTVTAKNAVVEAVEAAEGEHFTVEPREEGDGYVLRFSDGYLEDTGVTLDPKVTLKVSLEGYAFPISKTITVSTVSTKPSLSLTPASSIVNTAVSAGSENAAVVCAGELTVYGSPSESGSVITTLSQGTQVEVFREESVSDITWAYIGQGWVKLEGLEKTGMYNGKYTTFQVYNKTSGEYVHTDYVQVTASFAEPVLMDNTIQLLLTGTTGGTATVQVQEENWVEPIKLTHKVSVQTKLPTLKLSTTTLKLNAAYPAEISGAAAATLNQSNLSISDITFVPASKANTTTYTNASRITLTYADGTITAEFNDETLPANGTYSYYYTATLSNGASLARGTIKVTVSKTLPTLKLKSTTLKLNTVYPYETASTGLTLSTSPCGLWDIPEFVSTAKTTSSTYAEAGKIQWQFDPDAMTITASLDADNLPKAGTYSFAYTPVLDNGTALAKGTIKVTVHKTLPTLKLGKSTLTLNSLFSQKSDETTISLSSGELGSVEFASTAKVNSSTWKQAQKIVLDVTDGILTASFADPEDPAKAGTYSFSYKAEMDGHALKTGTVKVAVTSSAPKVTLGSSTIKLNRYLYTDEVITVTTKLSGSGYELAGFAELDPGCWTDLGSGIELTFLEESKQLQLRLASDEAATKTIKLTPVVRDLATGQEITLTAKNSLKVQVYNNAKLSVSLTAKGSLNTLNPDGAITYSVKQLTNAVGTAQFLSLEGQDAALFHGEEVDGKVVVTLRQDVQYATNKTYKVQLKFTVCGREVLSSAVSIKVAQSALKLSAAPKTVTYYQFQDSVNVELKLMAPATVSLADALIELNTAKTTAAFRRAMGSDEITAAPNEDGTVTLTFAIANPGLLVSGKSYTVVVNVTPTGNASNIKPTQVSMTVKALK